MNTQHRTTSISRINSLDSRLVASAMRVFERCSKVKIPIYITWGHRSFEEQSLLFRFGRSIPGQTVTSRRAGFSAHNYGLALDYCLLFEDTLLSWEDVYPRFYWRRKWLKVAAFFEEEGWESGWRQPSFEPQHVQNLLGQDLLYYVQQHENSK